MHGCVYVFIFVCVCSVFVNGYGNWLREFDAFCYYCVTGSLIEYYVLQVYSDKDSKWASNERGCVCGFWICSLKCLKSVVRCTDFKNEGRTASVSQSFSGSSTSMWLATSLPQAVKPWTVIKYSAGLQCSPESCKPIYNPRIFLWKIACSCREPAGNRLPQMLINIASLHFGCRNTPLWTPAWEMAWAQHF